MPRNVSPKKILIACQMFFDGKSARECADAVGVVPETISNWRKLDLWHAFEKELIAAYKKQVLSQEDNV